MLRTRLEAIGNCILSWLVNLCQSVKPPYHGSSYILFNFRHRVSSPVLHRAGLALFLTAPSSSGSPREPFGCFSFQYFHTRKLGQNARAEAGYLHFLSGL
ncbi:hypothetical protein HRR83_003697 [Exophiala dermatitidis]|nr:hypothetical protein HRR74_002922 [Exophiala dermatitidis]KAJ4529663.1 hypothetical protein HRR73_000690 [Exophiala dermatitidis]KAJ4543174.1 hypothetical protein HRR77_005430 [Exophiala dermatitidis]KAJ4543673.1 hypothetical protein HRR76_001738 [Exophiala dermatitidis]KAJ4575137.1 hypothetical protein HRR79_002068 [Exophiala dermatitidis]